MAIKLNGHTISLNNIKKVRIDGHTVYSSGLQIVDFLTCSWEDIATRCDLLESGSITTIQFCTMFTNGGTIITSMDDFVGLERSITVNNQVHKVRVIGTQHDALSSDNSKKAALTFEFKNLLSDIDGNSITTFWNRGASDNSKNYDYLNSSLYKCMEGAGNGGQDTSFQGIKWYKKDEAITTTDGAIAGKTVLDMLPEDLRAVLKQVEKEIGISTDSGSTKPYPKQTYNCKLFNLSYREMTATGTSTYQSEEGTAYKYYADHDTNTDRIKKQVNNAAAYTANTTITDSGYSGAKNYAGYNGTAGETGNGGICWLRSPRLEDTYIAWGCFYSGSLYGGSVYSFAFGIAPAFCI